MKSDFVKYFPHMSCIAIIIMNAYDIGIVERDMLKFFLVIDRLLNQFNCL